MTISRATATVALLAAIASAAAQAIWDEMNGLVERRDGKAGLEFTEVFPVGATGR